MLSAWLQLKRWLRALLIALSTEQPVDWTKEANKLGTIIEQAEEPKRKLGWRLRKMAGRS